MSDLQSTGRNLDQSKASFSVPGSGGSGELKGLSLLQLKKKIK